MTDYQDAYRIRAERATEHAYAEAAKNDITEEMIEAAIDAWNDVHDMDVPDYRYAIAVIEAVMPLIRKQERGLLMEAAAELAALVANDD